MKKLFALILAAATIFSLVACGKNGASAAKSDTQAVAIGAVVLARDDVSEDSIYQFVSTIFENTAEITGQHAKGAELNLGFAAGVTSVPYHPGAAKYFREKGYGVAVKDGAGIGVKNADLKLGTGSETGTYYAFGTVLSNYVSENSDFKVTAVTSGGSKANIEDMMAGDVQLAFAQSDVLAYAYNGERLFDVKITGFSVVAALYMEQVQIVTTKSNIASVADLEGKSVSIGAVGSGVYFNAIDLLDAYGLTESDITPVYQSFDKSVDSLKDGKIDAAFIVAGAPTPAITGLASGSKIYLVSIDQEHTDSLLASSPYYTAYTIPAGTY